MDEVTASSPQVAGNARFRLSFDIYSLGKARSKSSLSDIARAQ